MTMSYVNTKNLQCSYLKQYQERIATSAMGSLFSKWTNKALLIVKFGKDNYGTETKRLQSISWCSQDD